MSNAYARFLQLLPQTPLQVGTVVAASAGSVFIDLPGGGRIKARGEATVGGQVFVRDSVIEGTAPDLPVVEIDI